MSLQTAFEAGQFAISCELGPPKGVDITEALAVAEAVHERVHAVNVTDNQAAVMRMCTLAMCIHLKQRGYNPILQCTGRDRNRLALQADLLGAASFGITDVLALTGDHVVVGDHPEAKSVFDLESVQILQAIARLNEGTDLMGNPLNGTPRLFAGAVVTPESHPIEPQLAKFELKIKAGAKFFQTQAVYDIDRFATFMEFARPLGAKVMAGVVVLRSARMARFMNKRIPGVTVPEDIIDYLEAADDQQAAGIEVAGRFIRKARELCDGVHVMAVGAEHLVPSVLDAAGLTEVYA